MVKATEIVHTMEEDKNLEKDGAFALNEFGQKDR